MSNLPTVMAKVTVSRSLGAKNAHGGHSTNYEEAIIEVEVLTLHFAKGTMRVRYTMSQHGDPKITTVNISSEPYFEKYGWPKEPASDRSNW